MEVSGWVSIARYTWYTGYAVGSPNDWYCFISPLCLPTLNPTWKYSWPLVGRLLKSLPPHREQRELPGKMHSPVSTQTNSVNISLLFILIGVTEMEAVCIYGPKSHCELLIGARLLWISFPSLSSTKASWNNFLINFLQMALSPRLSLRSPSWTINCQSISFLDVSNVCMFHRQSTRQSLKHSHTIRDFCVII